MTRLSLRRAPLALAIALICGAAPLWAQNSAPPLVSAAAQEFNIPAQALGDALNVWARQARAQLAVQQSLVAGKRAPTVSGRLTPQQALDRLLAGSGLAAEIQGGEVIVRPVAAATTSLAAVTVTAQAERSHLTEGTGRYASRDLSMAKGQSVKEIPQSVSVITRQQIEDQGMQSIADVMQQMPGVVVAGDVYQNSNGNYYSRGYAVTNVQTDGVFDSSINSYVTGGNSISNLAMYDHVEVLRGADGLYSGTGSSSGTINLVRKRPSRDFRGAVTVAAGSWDNYRGEIDLAGPLGFDGKIRGRFVAAKQDRQYFYDYSKTDTDFLYGILEADLGERTMLTVGGNHEKVEGVPESGGFPTFNNGTFLGLSRSTNWVTPWSDINAAKKNAFVKLDHELNGGWKLSASANWTNHESQLLKGRIVQPVDPQTMVFRRFTATRHNLDSTTTSFDLNVSGRGVVLGHSYDLLVGLDRHKSDYDLAAGSMYSDAMSTNIYDVNMASLAQPSIALTSHERVVAEQNAVYSRIKVDLRDDLHFVIGARLTNYRNKNSSKNWSESGILTPSFGIIYDLNDRWSMYASTAKIYQSQANRLRGPINSTTSLDPMEGRNHEVGIKGDLYGGRLTGSLAVYQFERLGEYASDSAYSGVTIPDGLGCCYVNKGHVVSRGLEAEVNGEVLPRLQVSASYAYNSNTDKTTNAAYNVVTAPRHLVKLWSKYNFEGALSNLSIGGGVRFQSKTWSEGSNSNFGGYYRINQPGYGIWDALVEYKFSPNTQISLNVANVFDKTYYSAISSNFFGNYYGSPRSFMLTMRTAF